MQRHLALISAGVFALAFAVPAGARSLTSADPQCGGGQGEKKDEKKNPSLTSPECGGGQGEKKDEKKNPSLL